MSDQIIKLYPDKCKTCEHFWLSFKEIKELGTDPCSGCDQKTSSMYKGPAPLKFDLFFDGDGTAKNNVVNLARNDGIVIQGTEKVNTKTIEFEEN